MENTVFFGFLVIAYFAIICQGQPCADKVKNCATFRQLCNAASHKKWMEGNCKKTCGNCKQKQEKCDDSSKHRRNCPIWKRRGFCTQRNYIDSMKRYCKKTCDYCQPTVPLPPVDGGYSIWSPWPTCSRPCGPGVQERKRDCNNPKPRNGGATCVGKSKEVRSCNIQPCQPKSCSDNVKHAKNCIGWASFCEKGNEYYGFMQLNCKQTCGFCGKVTPSVPPLPDSSTCGIDKPVITVGRIVGGSNADPNRWVWQGALYYFDDYICGGSLIEADLFLTAAHCVEHRGKEGMMIKMGDHNRSRTDAPEQDRYVEKVIYHDDWDIGTIQNDIAIIKVTKKFDLNNKVGKVCLPGEDDAELNEKSLCYITGWGKTNINEPAANILQEAQMPIVPNDVCTFKNSNSQGLSKVTDTMICGGEKDVDSKVSGCRGDSGGPYVCKRGKIWILRGVVSWGSSRCDASHRFTVFTRVSSYIDWIKKTKDELARMI